MALPGQIESLQTLARLINLHTLSLQNGAQYLARVRGLVDDEDSFCGVSPIEYQTTTPFDTWSGLWGRAGG